MNRSNDPCSRRRALHALGAAAAVAGAPLWVRAADSGEIRIGQSVHLTGPLSSTIPFVIKGQALAIDEVNRRGGIHGRKVRLITLDDAYDPKRCVENVNHLVDREQVVALYGLTSTANVLATLPVLHEKKVPLVGVYSGSPALRAKHHPYFFTTMASYSDEMERIIRNLVTLGRGQAGLVYQNSPVGELMLPVVEQKAKELGATLAVKAALQPDGSNSRSVAETLAAAKVQSVVFMSFGPSLVPFVRAARAISSAPIYCVSTANATAWLQALGDQARGLAFATIVPYPWRATTAIARDFNAAMAGEKLKVDYDHFFGYLNLRVLLEGIRRGGRTVTPASVVGGMESMRSTDVGGFPVDYSPANHHGATFVDTVIVGQEGKYLR
jgi:branched-chain amino acid transport system substrate-binding protein